MINCPECGTELECVKNGLLITVGWWCPNCNYWDEPVKPLDKPKEKEKDGG